MLGREPHGLRGPPKAWGAARWRQARSWLWLQLLLGAQVGVKRGLTAAGPASRAAGRGGRRSSGRQWQELEWVSPFWAVASPRQRQEVDAGNARDAGRDSRKVDAEVKTAGPGWGPGWRWPGMRPAKGGTGGIVVGACVQQLGRCLTCATLRRVPPCLPVLGSSEQGVAARLSFPCVAA